MEACHVGVANDGCIHTKSLSISLPRGGDIIYGVAHQHKGGVGLTLYLINLPFLGMIIWYSLCAHHWNKPRTLDHLSPLSSMIPFFIFFFYLG